MHAAFCFGSVSAGNVVHSNKAEAIIEEVSPPKAAVSNNISDDDLLESYFRVVDDGAVDLQLVYDLIAHIFSPDFSLPDERGSVLVFLPGWDDIAKLSKMIDGAPFMESYKIKLFQLHSGISKESQREVFRPLTKNMQSKIILSTNIAETSVTIDDVRIVIDTGRLREKIYDPHLKLTYLKTSWISQVNYYRYGFYS